MNLCKNNIECDVCASRGMCSSYANYMYQKGIKDGIEKFVDAAGEWIDNIDNIRGDHSAVLTMINLITIKKTFEDNMILSTNQHVCCLDCSHCDLDENANTNCGFESLCDNLDPEDTRPFSERPMFLKK